MEFERVNLFVQTVDGKKTQVELDRYATIAHLKEAIRNETGHAVMDQKLMLYGNFELYNSQTLASYDLVDNSTVFLVTATATADQKGIPVGVDDDEDYIIPTFFVKDFTGKSITLHSVAQSTTIDEVKTMISEKQGTKMPKQHMRLIFGNHQLEDGKTLKTYGVGKDSNVYMVARLRGGCGEKL